MVSAGNRLQCLPIQPNVDFLTFCFLIRGQKIKIHVPFVPVNFTYSSLPIHALGSLTSCCSRTGDLLTPFPPLIPAEIPKTRGADGKIYINHGREASLYRRVRGLYTPNQGKSERIRGISTRSVPCFLRQKEPYNLSKKRRHRGAPS